MQSFVLAILAFLTATADRQGVTIHSAAPHCLVNRQLAHVGFNAWSEIAPYTTPPVGSEVLVQCWYPGTSVIVHVTTTVQGYAVFVPFVEVVTQEPYRE